MFVLTVEWNENSVRLDVFFFLPSRYSVFTSSTDTVTSPCHLGTVHVQIWTLQLNIFACPTLFITQTERLYPLLRPGICSSHSLLLFTLWILQVFPECMNAFMIQSDRGQYSWRFQVYVVLFSPKALQRWRRKPDLPLLQAACRKIWNLRNLFLSLSSKVHEINPLGNADALNRLLLSLRIIHLSSLSSLSLV